MSVVLPARTVSVWTLLVRELRGRGDGDGEPPAAPADKPATPPAPNPEVERLHGQIKAMRDHLAAYGTAVGALATAVLAGVGWATFTSFAPLPSGAERLWWLVAIGGVLALGGSVLLVQSFFAAQRRLAFRLEKVPERGGNREDDLSRHDAAAARVVLDAIAAREGARDIDALRLRLFRIERAARVLGWRAATSEDGSAEQAEVAAHAAALRFEATRLGGVIQSAGLQASVKIVETRSRRVFRSRWSTGLALSTAAGILLLLLLSDYVQGERQLVTNRGVCVEKAVAIPGATCTVAGELEMDLPVPTPVPTASPRPTVSDAAGG